MNKNLLETISPKYLGIIWATKGLLSEKLEYFEEINYLFNGILNKSKNSEKTTLLLGNSFGNPFFLTHIQENDSMIEQNLDQTLQIIKSLNSDNKNILFIGDKKIKLTKFKDFKIQIF